MDKRLSGAEEQYISSLLLQHMLLGKILLKICLQLGLTKDEREWHW